MRSKFFEIIMLLIVIAFMATGCGKSDVESNDFLAFEKSSLLDKYETKTLVDGITYKELSYTDSENNLRLSIIVYNDTNNSYYISASVNGYKNNQRTSQVSQIDYIRIGPKSAGVLGILLIKADSYRLNLTQEIKNDYLPSSAYKLSSYGFNLESQICNAKYSDINTLRLYFEYQSSGDNSAEVTLLGFKNNEYVYKSVDYITYVDKSNKENYSLNITKKGDRGTTEYFTCGAEYNIDEIDNFIYFVTGYYKD